MTFDEAMAQADKDAWVKSVDEEHQRMIDCGVWVPIRKEDLPPNCDIIDSTWSMKKKASGKYRARLDNAKECHTIVMIYLHRWSRNSL